MWIARDLEDDSIWLYKSKPVKDGKSFMFNPIDDLDDVIELKYIDKGLHALFGIDNLTFENSPIELEVKVKQK